MHKEDCTLSHLLCYGLWRQPEESESTALRIVVHKVRGGSSGWYPWYPRGGGEPEADPLPPKPFQGRQLFLWKISQTGPREAALHGSWCFFMCCSHHDVGNQSCSENSTAYHLNGSHSIRPPHPQLLL